MKTKGQNVLTFIVGVLLTGILVALAVFGIGDFTGVNADSVTLGLDLVGGSRIVYEANRPEGYNNLNLADDVQTAVSMIQGRLNTLGYTEATVTTEGTDRIVVEIPKINASEAIEKIGANGVITFELYDATTGKYTVVLTSENGDVTEAKPAYYEEDGGYIIQVTLATEAAQSKFTEASKKAASGSTSQERAIYIRQDGNTISSPQVDTKYASSGITGESFIISGSFTRSDAEYYANLINSGSLPFTLDVISDDNVGATLGQNALNVSLIAGFMGIVLVMIIMLLFYRLPGIVAVLALTGYTAALALCIVVFNVQLSLPGIAGIILSIGMAVDANVIIYERMKEELLLGKSTSASVKGSFKRAFTSILDSNITTLIAAVVLYFFGSGSVKGFAVTLFLGVLLSMVFAILVTRFFLYRLVGMGARNPWLYGVSNRKLKAVLGAKEGK